MTCIKLVPLEQVVAILEESQQQDAADLYCANIIIVEHPAYGRVSVINGTGELNAIIIQKEHAHRFAV